MMTERSRKIRGGFIVEKNASGRWRGVGVFISATTRYGLTIERDVEVLVGKHALARGRCNLPVEPSPIVGLSRWRCWDGQTKTGHACVLHVEDGRCLATDVENFLLIAGVEGIVDTTPEAVASARVRYNDILFAAGFVRFAVSRVR